MLSLRGRLIKLLLRSHHLFLYHWRKKPVDWTKEEAILEFRRLVEEGGGKAGKKLPEGIEIVPEPLGSIYAEWILPANVTKDRIMLYFHGGGYVCGSSQSHRAITAKFVNGSQVGALLFDYRLAPEHPYPQGLEDALTVYRRLLDQGIPATKIVFIGDSGGGGLVLATLLALRDQGAPLPTAAVAISPVTDFTCSGESHQTKRKLCLSPEGITEAIAKHYAGVNDPKLSYISPLFGDFRGLPPLLLFAGEDEILRDDATRLATKAIEAGVDVSLRVGKGMFHCYPAMAPLFPEAVRAMEEICEFIKEKVNE